MKKLIAAVALAIPLVVSADEPPPPPPPPALVVGGALVAAYTVTQFGVCHKDPCNAAAHLAGGALLGKYLKKEYGPTVAFLSVLALGISKELVDKHFDAKDAALTGLGGLLSVTWEW